MKQSKVFVKFCFVKTYPSCENETTVLVFFISVTIMRKALKKMYKSLFRSSNNSCDSTSFHFLYLEILISTKLMHLWCRTMLSSVRISGNWKPLWFGKEPNHWDTSGCPRRVTRGIRNPASFCWGQHAYGKGIPQLVNTAEPCPIMVSYSRHALQTLLPFLWR